jgi:hypothetical protein
MKKESNSFHKNDSDLTNGDILKDHQDDFLEEEGHEEGA